MKRLLKKVSLIVLSLVLGFSLIGIHTSIKVSAATNTSITLDDSYQLEKGSSVSITAVYKSETEPTNIKWACDKNIGLIFSGNSIVSPSETKEENTWWISTMITGITEGEYNVKLEINGKSSNTSKITVQPQVIKRYTALILDGSGSMEGTPVSVQQTAARSFCQQILNSNGEDYISVIRISGGSTTTKLCDFTNDISVLERAINNVYNDGGTDMIDAVKIAENLLDGIDDSGKNVIKNIVLCSDGLPEIGNKSENGPYSSNPYGIYEYICGCANQVYNECEFVKAMNINIYTLGFFHSLGKIGNNFLDFGRKFMTDIASSPDKFYEVTDPSNLEFTFDAISDVITMEPLIADLETVNLIDEDDLSYTYEVVCKLTNMNETTVTGISVTIDTLNGSLIEGNQTQNVESLIQEDPNDDVNFVDLKWKIRINKSDYAFGGVYYFNIDVQSNEAPKLVQTGTITINPSSYSFNELDFSKDIWKFGNPSDRSGWFDLTEESHEKYILEKDKNALLSGLQPSEKALMEYVMRNDGANGHCYGMSTTVILNKMGIIDVSQFTNGKKIHNADFDNEGTHSLICYWALTQFLKNPRALVQSLENVPMSTKLETIASMADNVKNGGAPVLLGIEWFGPETDDNGDLERSGHAIVAYALEPGNFTVNKHDYNRRILIYDCNSTNSNGEVKWNKNYCIYFNEGTDEWEIPAYKIGSPYNNQGNIHRYTNDLSLMNVKDYNAGLLNYTAELVSKSNSNVEITNSSSQSWVVDKNGVFGNSKLVTYVDEDGNNSNLHIVLPDESDTYTVKTKSGLAENLEFNILYNDKFIAVKCDKAIETTFSPDGTVNIKSNEGHYEVTIADDNMNPGEFDTYVIEGDNPGDVSITINNKKVEISGDDLEGVTVTGSNENASDTIVIGDKIDDVSLKQEDNKLVIDNNSSTNVPTNPGTTEGNQSSTESGNNNMPLTGVYKNPIYILIATIGLAIALYESKKKHK